MSFGLWLFIIWLVISGVAGLIGSVAKDMVVGLALFALVGFFVGIVFLFVWAVATIVWFVAPAAPVTVVIAIVILFSIVLSVVASR